MFFRTNKNRKASKSRNQARRLQMERMEERQLMAADIDLVGRTLQVEGSDYGDKIIFQNINSSYVSARVTDMNGNVRVVNGESMQKNYLRSSIDRLYADGNGGGDEINNFTDIPMTARGGSGDDKIDGGSAADWLRGDSGKDVIRGGEGDDIIEGGWHDDTLYGMGGDDTIYGQHGNDILRGGNQNDNLYGGEGYDRVYGEAGNDGLFGGNGFDRLYTGTGSDRLLKDSRNNDSIYEMSGNDAVITLKDSGPVTYTNGGNNIRYSGNSWNDASIEAIDQVFDRLHDLTGTTNLLKSGSGGSMTYYRVGDWLGSTDSNNVANDAGENYGGWNPHNGTIFLTNVGMSGAVISMEQVVIHEIGHNWDWYDTNPSISRFFGYSGWTLSPTTEVKTFDRRTRLWSRVVVQNDTGRNANDSWWRVPGADSNFVSDYAEENGIEDFAETFVAYVLGSEYIGFDDEFNVTGGIEDTPFKKKYMEDFIKSM